MKMNWILTIIFVSAFFTAGCGNEANSVNSNRTATNSTGADRGNTSTVAANGNTASGHDAYSASNTTGVNMPTGDFWTQAAQAGMAEVEIGQLAATNAQNAEVKRFAQMMVQDHTKSNNELKALAEKKNISLPTSLGIKHIATRDRLKLLFQEKFDAEYMSAMVSDHEEAVRLFENQSNSGTDPDAKAFAAKSLPVLKRHLESAKSIKAKLQ